MAGVHRNPVLSDQHTLEAAAKLIKSIELTSVAQARTGS